MTGTWTLDWSLEIGLELGAWIGTWIGTWISDRSLKLTMELGASNLERGLKLGIIVGIGAWSLDWVLKLGGLKHLKS